MTQDVLPIDLPAIPPKFRYVDLFCGIGGFAAVLNSLGGESVYSVEIDEAAAAVYKLNWNQDPLGDVTQDANEVEVRVPDHDVLAAGFPCQPFSKSGSQKGMEEARGTLFWNIMRVIEVRKPKLVILENVRNLAGPRHKHEWDVIIRSLSEAGYTVSKSPSIFSPHRIERASGGRPQSRERVFITATYSKGPRLDPDMVEALTIDPARIASKTWNLLEDLPLIEDRQIPGTELSSEEESWIDAWSEFVKIIRGSLEEQGMPSPLPGFPIWVDSWGTEHLEIDSATPDWKMNFITKNQRFYRLHQRVLDRWMAEYKVQSFPPSRRKFEWQAQEEKDLWSCVMQLRPSGIRAKKATHLPALVAINQTSIYGPFRRRLSVREVARLQGFPDEFDFGGQGDARSYKQLGNGVNLGVVMHVLKRHVERDKALLLDDRAGRSIVHAIENAPWDPERQVAANLSARLAAPKSHEL